jgi:cold shock CspA family protein/ribosome-associated translation inhibitor RaiA
MQLPLKIRLRDITHSEALEGLIREKASWLESFSDQIIGCRVVVEGPVRHHRKGGPYTVRIDLGVPGEDIVVNRQAADDPYVAVQEAFDAARRKLQDHVRRRRGAVKAHEEIPHGRVTKLFPDEGYGFLETPDGREVYFHRNSVLGADFNRLSIGTEVRFAEEEGEHGPQASTVTIVGKHHP